MIYRKCTHCDIGNTRVVEYSMDIPQGRRKVKVPGFLKTVCDGCDYEYVSMDQLDHNADIMESCAENIQAAVYPGILRSIRERWNITQRQLSRLFGAGESAVGKWESGAVMSGPSALLAQCAYSVPGTVEYLAHLADFKLNRRELHKNSVVLDAIAWRPHKGNFVYSSAANSHLYEKNAEKVFDRVAA